MAIALVGTIGAVSTGAVNTAVTPAWGTGQSRTANNLLVLWVSLNGATTTIATPSGWTQAVSNPGTSVTRSAIFYKTAAGADTAPTVAAIASGVINARLAEFSGVAISSPLDKQGINSQSTSPAIATASGLDLSTGSLIASASAFTYSAAATKTLTLAYNNATITSTTNAATSTANHYGFGYGVTTANAVADTLTDTYTTTSVTGHSGAFATFKPAVATIGQSSYRFYEDGTESGSTATAAQDTSISRDVNSDSNLAVRIRLQESGGAAGLATDDYTLMYSLNGGTYASIESYTKQQSQEDVSGTSDWTFFGGTSTSQTLQARAFSFTTTSTFDCSRIDLMFKKVLAPTDTVYMELVSGSVNGTVMATSDAINGASLSTTYAYVPFTFSSPATLSSATKYYVRVLRTGARDTTNGYSIDGSSTNVYAGGGTYSRDSNVWSAEGTVLDYGYRIYSTNTNQPVIPYSSASLTDGGATTNRLGAGTGSFLAGKVSETGLIEDFAITASNYTEQLYTLTLVSSLLSNTDLITFKVVRNGSNLNTYTVTPSITVSKNTPSISTLTDALNTNTYDTTKWTKYGNTSNINLTNNELQITVPSGGTEFNYYGSNSKYDWTGAGAYVHVKTPASFAINSEEAGLHYTIDANNKLWMFTGSGLVKAYKLVGGVQTQIGSNLIYAVPDHAYLRIREASGTWYFDTSPDGSTWTNRWSLLDPFSGVKSGYVWIYAQHWQSEATTTVDKFDNFNTVSGGGVTTGYKKVLVGGVWTAKPVKYLVSGTWTTKKQKIWNGSSWVESVNT